MLTRIVRRGCAVAVPVALLMTTTLTIPAAAAASGGGGSVAGAIVYATPLPPIYQGCSQTSWVLDSPSAPAAVASTAGTFVGDVTVTVAGNSGAACETTQGGAGLATVSMSSEPGSSGQLSCDQLIGTYIRSYTIVMTIQLQGQCTLDGQATWMVVDLDGVLAPPPPGPDGSVPGVTTSWSSAPFLGTWATVTT